MTKVVDDAIARLVREARLVEAAELLSSRGDRAQAAELFERACLFARAGVEAFAAGDAGRALLLAVQGGDSELAERSLAAVCDDRKKAERFALELGLRSEHRWAARLFERSGRTREAADAWERAGEAVAAALCFEKIGDPPAAARVLEAALRREPERADLAIALGKLLLRHGKQKAAVRALQRVGERAPGRCEALAALVPALTALGLEEAAREASRELAALGGSAPSAVPAEPPAPEADAPRTLYGRYEVLGEIASTASARVLECRDRLRGERVAVKILAADGVRGAGRDALSRFEREVRALRMLDHPNIVPLRDYLPEGPALVLAWMGGGTLEARIAARTLTPARSVEIATAVLRALGEAHRLAILHRDVKPSNVLFDDAGAARLGDFGVAHLADADATATAAVIGTRAYMSPEQRQGLPATVRSDIYGVGAMLQEMLTGAAPSVELPAAKRPHRGLGAAHDAVIAAFVASDPERRPAAAFDAARLLASVSWPNELAKVAGCAVDVSGGAGDDAPVSRSGASDRLRHAVGGASLDHWTGRAIECVPLDNRVLARARGFAQANDPALQTVLRVAQDDGALWLDAVAGAVPTEPLSGDAARSLRRALERLHARGVAHGAVGCEAIRITESGAAVLLFLPVGDATATANLDLLALHRLAGG